eukprot:10183778-Alexandrium_andersonii.AAC.1
MFDLVWARSDGSRRFPSIARRMPDAGACKFSLAEVAEALEVTSAVRIMVCLGDFGASSKKPLQLLGAAL